MRFIIIYLLTHTSTCPAHVTMASGEYWITTDTVIPNSSSPVITWVGVGKHAVQLSKLLLYILSHDQVHRAFMMVSLFIGAIGVAMVFIGHAHEDNPRGLIRLGSSNVRIYTSMLPLFGASSSAPHTACCYFPLCHWTLHRTPSNHKR